MSYYSQVIKLVKQLGASIDKDCRETSSSKSWIIDAPDGKQWAGAGCSGLVVEWYPSWPESKEEAFKDALERMNYGIEDIDEDI